MIRNNLKPKFYSNHRTRNRIRNNSFNEKELFFQAQEALKQRRKFFLEVGFGDGKSVIDMANKNPEVSFFCIETYSKGLSLLTEKIQEKDQITISGLDQLAQGKPLTVTLKHDGGGSDEIAVEHTLNEKEIQWFYHGSALNYVGSQK